MIVRQPMFRTTVFTALLVLCSTGCSSSVSPDSAQQPPSAQQTSGVLSLRTVETFAETPPAGISPLDAARACVYDAVRVAVIAMEDSPVSARSSTVLGYAPEQSTVVSSDSGQVDLEIYLNPRTTPSYIMRGPLNAGTDLDTLVAALRTSDLADFPVDFVDDVMIADLQVDGDALAPSDVLTAEQADRLCGTARGGGGSSYPGFIDVVVNTYGLDRSGLPAEAPTPGCPGLISDYRDATDSNVGTYRVSIVTFPSYADPEDAVTAEGGANACVAVTLNEDSSELLTIPIDVYSLELFFATPAVDSTGNVFVNYNPGRYNGLIVISPDGHGGVKHFDHYYADLVGPGPDGQYEIEQHSQDCAPSCAEGSVTTQKLRWNGTDYVP